MNRAASYFVGKHDFAAFCSTKSDIDDTVRTIYRCEVLRDGDDVLIKTCGDGFLYNMVRIIAGTLIDVAKDKIKADDIPLIIKSKTRKNAGKTLSAKGLFLNKVYYSEVELES